MTQMYKKLKYSYIDIQEKIDEYKKYKSVYVFDFKDEIFMDNFRYVGMCITDQYADFLLTTFFYWAKYDNIPFFGSFYFDIEYPHKCNKPYIEAKREAVKQWIKGMPIPNEHINRVTRCEDLPNQSMFAFLDHIPISAIYKLNKL